MQDDLVDSDKAVQCVGKQVDLIIVIPLELVETLRQHQLY